MQVEEGDIESINSTLVGSIILVEGTGLSLLIKKGGGTRMMEYLADEN